MPDNSTSAAADPLHDQEDVDFVIELLDDFAVQCKIVAEAARRRIPIRPVLFQFDGAWLFTRVMLEAMDRDDAGNGRRAALDYSADVLRQLKQVRREAIVEEGGK
ncbi:MAG TPA: hypothetical protein VLA19_29795 [Herpetosiphonaceae bacterium]|nr:hypothetical protein [Herpetosiphonaceae bacterium]